jgi:hypothetical protein
MTTSGFNLRGALYVLIASLPVIKAGLSAHAPVGEIGLDTAFAAAVAVRAFVDKSGAELEQSTLQEAATLATIVAPAPVASAVAAVAAAVTGTAGVASEQSPALAKGDASDASTG